LLDGDHFAATIAKSGAELILHGHMHRMSRKIIPTPRGPVPVIGVASASARSQHSHCEQAQFHLYTLQRDGAAWTVNLEIRALDETTLSFREYHRLKVPVLA
jgi:hypothetical protein